METLIELVISKQSGVLARVLASLSPMGLKWKNHSMEDGSQEESHNLRIVATGNISSIDQLIEKFSAMNGVIKVLNIAGNLKAPETSNKVINDKRRELVTTLLQRRLLSAKAVNLGDGKELDSANKSLPNKIDLYFSCILHNLIQLMEKVGGDSFQKQLEECIVISAIQHGWDLEEYISDVKIEDLSVFSKHYRDIVNDAIKFSVGLLGKNLVLESFNDLHSGLRDLGFPPDDITHSCDVISMVENTLI